jgi:hypothetical protein
MLKGQAAAGAFSITYVARSVLISVDGIQDVADHLSFVYDYTIWESSVIWESCSHSVMQ